MVGLAAICRAIWQARNNVCFERKKIRSPTEITWSTSSFLKYWAGLQKEEGRDMLEAGAEVLKNAALHHHPKNKIMESEDLGLCCSSKEDVGKSEEQGRQDQTWRRMK
jgi:hypothetical protein